MTTLATYYEILLVTTDEYLRMEGYISTVYKTKY